MFNFQNPETNRRLAMGLASLGSGFGASGGSQMAGQMLGGIGRPQAMQGRPSQPMQMSSQMGHNFGNVLGAIGQGFSPQGSIHSFPSNAGSQLFGGLGAGVGGAASQMLAPRRPQQQVSGVYPTAMTAYRR